MIRPYNPLPPPGFMHLSNQIPGNINCNITSSALLLETKSVIRVEHIATCWDINTDFRSTSVSLRPSPSNTFRGHRLVKPNEEGVRFLPQKEDLLITVFKNSFVSGSFVVVVVFLFLSMFTMCRERNLQQWGQNARGLQSNWSSTHPIPS